MDDFFKEHEWNCSTHVANAAPRVRCQSSIYALLTRKLPEAPMTPAIVLLLNAHQNQTEKPDCWTHNTHSMNATEKSNRKPELIWKLTCSGYLKGIMQAVGMGKLLNAHMLYTQCATVMGWLRDIPTGAVAAWLSQGELTTSWWMAIVSYIVQYLNTLGEGKNFYLWIFLPASMAFELWGTNYPHVFFYKSGNKFLSHLSCSWQQEHNCNAFQHRRRVGLDWRMTHFPFPYFIWLGTLGAVLAKFQSRRLLPPQISHCVINWTHTHIYKKKNLLS